MKKLALIVLCFSTIVAYTQEKKYNQFSIETSYGLNHPLTPKDNSGFDVGLFSEFKHFDIGGRYMINQMYGAKLSYAYDRFQYKNTSELAVTYHRISAEVVFNMAKVFNISFNKARTFQIQTHTGFGITLAQPKSIDNYERIGNFIIGLTPQVKITDRLAITTDLSYIVSFKQHYDYGGILIDPEYKGTSGSFINATIGLQVSLGEKKYHADWY
ncbi:MAG: hypothetical protein IMY67_10035 [Bacteroidetes bacterium]|nr:hypothetical protein [Bacteroidota bacterium]